jgi:hypothetical protein
VNRVLRKMFGLKRDEVMGAWRNVHNKELHDLYSSQRIIIIIKSRMREAGHEKRAKYSLLVRKSEGKRPLGRPNVSGWIILRWIL